MRRVAFVITIKITTKAPVATAGKIKSLFLSMLYDGSFRSFQKLQVYIFFVGGTKLKLQDITFYVPLVHTNLHYITHAHANYLGNLDKVRSS